MPKKMIAERKDVADEDKWILTPLFETDTAGNSYSQVRRRKLNATPTTGNVSGNPSAFSKKQLSFTFR